MTQSSPSERAIAAGFRVLSDALNNYIDSVNGEEDIDDSGLYSRRRRLTPQQREVLDKLRDLREQFVELHKEQREAQRLAEVKVRRRQRTQFMWGIALGLPVGLLGAYIAHVLGWG